MYGYSALGKHIILGGLGIIPKLSGSHFVVSMLNLIIGKYFCFSAKIQESENNGT